MNRLALLAKMCGRPSWKYFYFLWQLIHDYRTEVRGVYTKFFRNIIPFICQKCCYLWEVEGTYSNATLGKEGCREMAKPSLGEKDIFNPEEAICYWNFSRKKFYRFLEETDGGDYLAFYKQRKLIIRVSFEQFLFKNPEVKEALANGKSRKRKD